MTIRRYLDACADRDWSDFEQNGKLTRFVFFADNDATTTAEKTPRRSSTTNAAVTAARLTPRNAIRLLFAFGDVNMLNCEDGYVLNERARILADTTLCRKIGFSCANPVAFRSRMTLEYTHDLGVRVHVGTFHSTNHVRFFNTSNPNTRVLTRPCRRRTVDGGVVERSYDLYILWNSSFLQRRIDKCGIVKEIATRRERGDGNDESLLREWREYATAATSIDDDDDGPIGESVMELHTKYVRVILRAKGTRQTIKLQNSFGQKGIARYADLSDLVTDRGERVDLISSMYSLLGRFACGQLLEQRSDRRYIFSKSSGLCVGTGGYGYFFVSDDSAHNNFIYSVKHGGGNPMRVCKLTYESFLENGLSSGAFVKSSEFECGITNPYAGVPRNVSRALNCYGIYDKSVHLRSQSILNERQRALDRLIVEAITQRSSAAASVATGGRIAEAAQQEQSVATTTKKRDCHEIDDENEKKKRRRHQRSATTR